MRILCLNTAFKEAEIILDNNGEITKRVLDSNAKSSESVLPAIEDILFNSSLKISDIDVLGVVVGTGSFTGVRIGVSLVKGFVACCPNIKICEMNSLDLMAYEYVKTYKIKDNFCAVQNALSGRFFVGYYNHDGEKIKDYELVRELPSEKKIGLTEENLSEVEEKISFLPENLLSYTKKLIKKEKFIDVFQLAPVYLRLSQAEENLLEKTNNAKD